MSRYRCDSCQGEYDDVGADGVLYFHVCPPVTVISVTDDQGVDRDVPLRGLVGIALATSAADRDARIAAGARATQVYIVLARRQAPRKNARNENTLRREGATRELRILKAEGKGHTEIPASAPAEEPVDDAP